MIKIQDQVWDIVTSDHEALICLSRDVLNLSQYARTIKHEVELRTKKEIKLGSVVMALSRIKDSLEQKDSLVQPVVIEELTIKSPLEQLVFEKTAQTVHLMTSLDTAVTLRPEEWFIVSQNTKSISILCRKENVQAVTGHMKTPPLTHNESLAAMGLSLSETYQKKPNIMFSLLHKVAKKNIPLVDSISTWGEVILVFEEKYLAPLMEVFRK